MKKFALALVAAASLLAVAAPASAQMSERGMTRDPMASNARMHGRGMHRGMMHRRPMMMPRRMHRGPMRRMMR